MVAFNFKPEFTDKILSGVKRSTIRTTKRCKVGDIMQLYTGQRTKKCRKLKDAICTGVHPVTIDEHQRLHVDIEDAGYLWQREGFDSPDDFIDFFEDHYGLPFTGYLHKWSAA